MGHSHFCFLKTFLLLCSFLFISSAIGQVRWCELNGSNNGSRIYFMALGPDSILYCGTDSTLMSFSDDNTTWRAASSDLRNKQIKTMYFQDPTNWLLGTIGDGCYTSSDAGKSWRKINTFTPDSALAITKDNTGNLLASSSSRVWKSTNAGINWYELPANGLPISPRINDILVRDDGIIFLATKLGIYKSEDRGTNWDSVSGEFHRDYIYDFYVAQNGNYYAGSDSGVFRSEDEGLTWDPYLDILWQQPDVVKIGEMSDGFMYGTTNIGDIAQFTDATDSWNVIDSGLIQWRAQNYFSSYTAIAEDAHGVIWAGDHFGNIYRLDSTLYWQRSHSTLIWHDIRSLVMDSNGWLFAGAGHLGIYRSKDKGVSWEYIDTRSILTDCIQLVIDRSQNIFACGYDVVSGNTGHGKIIRSSDGGDSWQLSYQSPERWDDVQHMCVDSNGNVYASIDGESGIIFTHDNGDSWQQSTSGLEMSEDFTSLCATAGAVYAGSYGNELYRSSDQGQTWTKVGLKQSNKITGLQTLNATPTGSIFASSSNYGLFRSDDNGDNWTPLPSRKVVIMVDQNGVVYTSDPKGAFYSTDNGLNFEPLIDSFVNHGSLCLLLDEEGYLFSGNSREGVWRTISPVNIEISNINNQNIRISSLYQNTPNPFNGSTSIKFATNQRGRVSLKVFDVLGREVADLANRVYNRGMHEIVWQPIQMPSSVYYYTLNVGGMIESKKMYLIN